jgi:hypothetical protein
MISDFETHSAESFVPGNLIIIDRNAIFYDLDGWSVCFSDEKIHLILEISFEKNDDTYTLSKMLLLSKHEILTFINHSGNCDNVLFYKLV